MIGRKCTLVAITCLLAGGFWSSPARDENVVRAIRGRFLYRTTDGATERGHEEWYLTVHPDGSRTLRSTVQLAASGVLRDTIETVDASFRPRHGFMQLWVKGKPTGSALFTVLPDKLHAVINRPGEPPLVQENPAPTNFSFVLHPVSGDGWHFWYYDTAKGGEQELTVYNSDTMGAGPSGLLGKLEKHKAKFVGEEEVSVPAGNFKTRHFDLGGAFQMWVMGEDRICAKLTLPSAKFEYVLTEYRELR